VGRLRRLPRPFFLVNNLLLLNQFPDVAADRAGGRQHFVIAHGLRAGAAVYAVFHAGAFLSLAASVALGWLPPLALLGLATAADRRARLTGRFPVRGGFPEFEARARPWR